MKIKQKDNLSEQDGRLMCDHFVRSDPYYHVAHMSYWFMSGHTVKLYEITNPMEVRHGPVNGYHYYYKTDISRIGW